ncbi:MAG: D-tyrosyl-tRNA(Tyr) deacylase [Acidobacteria bacterium]|nr:D-tyrosyl-tRNA(Tyr) deacylase [Acidobacteriota bacterium]
MRAVVQRVSQAGVSVAGREVSAIGKGMLVLACVEKGDDEATVRWVAEKIRSLRIFDDGQGKMNLSIEEIGGEILAVSQFTLASRIDRGRRPGFEKAEEPRRAAELFRRFVGVLAEGNAPVKEGVFQAMMMVSLVNDGPVTFIVEPKP